MLPYQEEEGEDISSEKEDEKEEEKEKDKEKDEDDEEDGNLVILLPRLDQVNFLKYLYFKIQRAELIYLLYICRIFNSPRSIAQKF